jgi:hypothetical protein
MNNWCICWLFTHILLGILIFKGLTARRLFKSFGVKGLNCTGYLPYIFILTFPKPSEVGLLDSRIFPNPRIWEDLHHSSEFSYYLAVTLLQQYS